VATADFVVVEAEGVLEHHFRVLAAWAAVAMPALCAGSRSNP